MTGRHRDVSEDDYPTGPIDVWPLLAEDAPPHALVDDNGALHDKRNGRFVSKVKRAGRRVWTWADVRSLPCGPEYTNAGPTVFEWPDEPGVEWETTKYGEAVVSCKPTNSSNHVRVAPPTDRKPVPPSPAIVRAWAQRNGIPVNSSGRIPVAVMNAYREAMA